MKDEFLTQPSLLSAQFAKNLYERMLLARLVDEYVCRVQVEEYTPTYVSCRGYEAAQVGSAMCIEVGQDFTLPCTHDLGVVLTIGMTPYEVFRTYLNRETVDKTAHWSYQKHNTVTGATPAATQILHAAGIAFASKLRKAHAVTIAYCGDDVVTETDFLEGVRFSAQHELPILFICEHTCSDVLSHPSSCLDKELLPENLTHLAMSGIDAAQVYVTTQQAIQAAREGQGPILLEIFVSRSPFVQPCDPLLYYEQSMHTQGIWDEAWAVQLQSRLRTEVEQAMHDALRDTQSTHEQERVFSSHVF